MRMCVVNAIVFPMDIVIVIWHAAPLALVIKLKTI